MRLSEADAGKVFWRVLRGFSACHDDLLPRFEETPLDLRSAVTQTAAGVMDYGNESGGDDLAAKLATAGWTAGRYNEAAKTISFAQDPQNISAGILAGMRSATAALLALKEI